MASSNLLTAFQMIGIGGTVADRVIAHFGDNTHKIIFEEDPYRLMEIEGIGFTKADNAAKLLGIEDNDPRRQSALTLFIIENNKSFGHTFLPITVLEKALRKERIVAYDKILGELEERGMIVREDNRVYIRRLYEAETETVSYLKDRISSPIEPDMPTGDANADLDQLRAVALAPLSHLLVMTGGPGSGKTTTVRSICNILRDQNYSVGLCAPTGKAAKRMQDLTSRSASTIHRLLKAGYGTWKYNKHHPLTFYDYIICDEASMLDVELVWRLLQALPKDTRLVFVGDKDQLPPVGPGSFFRDIILSRIFPTIYLRTNHRQGKGSLIAENAMRINRGELKLSFDEDLEFVQADSPIDIRQAIIPLIRRLSKEYDPIRDIQILSPQHKTLCGVEALNDLLRYELNSNANPRSKFGVGDKVMQVVNDYNLDVFNGYCGRIADESRGEWMIEFFDADNRAITYPKSTANDGLMLSYACTIHKYQGSESKCVVVVVSSSHTYMLTRNLLYTAVTRAKEKCVIVGDLLGLRRAITNDREQERYSKLHERLTGLL